MRRLLQKWKITMLIALVACGLLSACGGSHDEPYQVFSSTVTPVQGGAQNVSALRGSGIVTFNVDDRRMTASLVITSGAPVATIQMQELAGNAATPSSIPLAREGNTNIWSTEIILSDGQRQLLQNAQYYFRAVSLSGPASDGSGQILEQFPFESDWNVLVDASAQSNRLRRQLDIVDAVANSGWDHSGVGLGLTFGF